MEWLISKRFYHARAIMDCAKARAAGMGAAMAAVGRYHLKSRATMLSMLGLE
jgi:hypothetical protein